MRSAVAPYLIRQRLVRAAVIPYRRYAGIVTIFPIREGSAIAALRPIRVILVYGTERVPARDFHAVQIIIPITIDHLK